MHTAEQNNPQAGVPKIHDYGIEMWTGIKSQPFRLAKLEGC